MPYATGAPGRTWIRRLWPAAAFQFAVLGAAAVLKPAANAVVVARYQAQALPWLYVAAAAITGGVTAVAAIVGRRRQRDAMWMAFAGAAVAVSMALFLRGGHSSSALLLYLFAESFTTFTAIAFWSAMSDAFDARESRKAFTVLSGFGMSGGIVGGLLTQFLAQPLGTAALVLMGAGLLVVAGVAFFFHRPEPGHAAAPAPRHGGTPAWEYLRAHAYPLALGALVLGFAVISPVADFIFRERAAQSLGETGLASLFGSQQLWVGIACALFQWFLAERLLGRLGVIRYLSLIPLVLLVFAIAVVIDGRLWSAYALKLVESAASWSLLPVAVQLLYAPIPDELRDRVRALMDGLVKKGGLALGGLLLVSAGPLLAGRSPALTLCALCAVVGVVLWRLRPAYVSALRAQVGEGEDPDAGLDRSTEHLLAESLRSPEPDHVLHAMELLEQGGTDLRPHLPALLAHPSDRVVERGVQLAAVAGSAALAPEIEALLESPMRRPRAEAVWTLAKLAPERAGARLPLLLEHPDPGVRAAAAGALWKVGTPEAARRAVAALEALTARGEQAPVAERREVARVLGRIGDERLAPALLRYLGDADGSVRALAMRAVGEGHFLGLAEDLLPCLMLRDTRKTAREALALLGDPVVALLEQALNDRTRPGSLRYELPRVLRLIGTQAAFDVLLFSNIRDDAFLHYRIGVALAWLKDEHPALRADVARVHEAIIRRRDVYRRLVGPFRDLRAALGDESLLTRAVGDRLDQAYELCFWLLGLLYPPRSLRRVHEHLVGPDPRRRAYALELFENLVPAEDRELVSEQTHAHHRELPLGAPGRLADHLGFLCHSDDHVLRACARQVARRLGLWTLPPMEDDMSDARVRKMFALERVEIFAASDVDDLAAVAQVAREHRFRAGERIYSEGDPGDALYVILSGTVDALRKGEKVLEVHANQAFGDVSLLDGQPRPTDMIAREDTTVLVIDRRDFLDLLSDRPELLQGVFRVVARQIREVVDLAANARLRAG